MVYGMNSPGYERSRVRIVYIGYGQSRVRIALWPLLISVVISELLIHDFVLTVVTAENI